MLHKSKLFQNILSLSSAEFINKLMMYFYLAYLAHHIGTIGIGSITLGQSIANFCFMALQIGFDSVGTREIARNKEKMESF
ncbi:MAG: oligosaccharide flippase family protein, partial [Candidatus Kapabacteria bacterium]|nr:oligosaccharide flippase family protein [Candidatus Kapabacteria bacterium]